MKILVTRTTGPIAEAVVRELLARDHSVRILSGEADDDARQWPGAEPFRIADGPPDLAAAGCDAIVHVDPPAGEDERPLPSLGDVVAAAEHAHVRRLVWLAPIDDDREDQHLLVRSAAVPWTILRHGPVIGPGDEIASTLLELVRVLPAVPVGEGERPFQPIWFEDLGRAAATVLEREDLEARTLEVAGDEATSIDDLLRRFSAITGRTVAGVPLPDAVSALAVDAPPATLLEHNALTSVLGIAPTPLDRALRILADAAPEQLPEEGVGAMEHKRFWAEIEGTAYRPESLMAYFREHVNEIMPVEFAAEPGAPATIELGVTLTAKLPLRGHIQVRVEVAEPTRVVLGTLEGHPLAGIVEFTTSASAGRVQFAIDVYARAANVFDFIALRTLGRPMQDSNWRGAVQRIIEVSGGKSDGVQKQTETLDAGAAQAVEMRVRALVQERKREQGAVPPHRDAG